MPIPGAEGDPQEIVEGAASFEVRDYEVDLNDSDHDHSLTEPHELAHFERKPSASERAAHRAGQRDTAITVVNRYNPDAVVCVGVPFGHTRPQWIPPYGGEITVDGTEQRIWADYR